MKASGVPGTGRLPSASGPPRAVWPAERRRLANLTTPFHPRLSSWARSPWAPPAETDGACLDLTSLAEICNHRKARAHPANDRSSHDVPFSGSALPRHPEAASSVRPELSPWTGDQRSQPRRPEHPESACAQRQQRPARATPNTSESPCLSRAGAGDSFPRQAGQDLPSSPPRERDRPSGSSEVLSAVRKPERYALTT